jgi:hypothetical protein
MTKKVIEFDNTKQPFQIPNFWSNENPVAAHQVAKSSSTESSESFSELLEIER